MAESRSARALEAPCIGVPPERLTVVLGVGEDVRELWALRTLGRSESRGPEAEGGGLGDAVRDVVGVEVVGLGSWRAAGLSDRARVFARGCSLRGRLVEAI